MSRRKTKLPFVPHFLLLLAAAVVYYLFFYHPVQPEIHQLSKPPAPFVSHGLDVSHHQGDINWEKLFTSLDTIVPFVYCKATEGLEHIDSQWDTNREELIKLHSTHGAYHFFLPDVDPEGQAKHFLSVYDFRQSDLPPVIDVETLGSSVNNLINEVNSWLRYVEIQTGKRPVIYTSYNYYKDWARDAFPNYKFWIANYSNKVQRFRDENIIHWQYSERGILPGINGHVDLNYSKIAF